MTFVHELGDAPIFPQNELISSFSIQTTLSACPGTDNPAFPNTLVRMVNLSGIPWIDVHYVADPGNTAIPGTTISNEDGLVNAGQAFRIDTIGVNKPLINESINPNGIFEPGETWQFVIDDFTNAFGLPATPFNSIGVGSGSLGPPSTGSIIASQVPEPGSTAFLGIGGAVLLVRRARLRRCACTA
jgi:hypothetical protein